ncbi:MAG: pantetheine-phosphate adenylyltransferase [Cyanobacteria bacterium M5B4]|nr:pantetheine-phosphate adenylyltransferase [Cyanobacteria bacterium KgW148]PLS68992.1 MAG: pantetheine-phosphate adenylyltransferase [Cyanobacteria bacterium M5B4]
MAAPLIAIYPGSFDPITLGHLDIITRSSLLFGQVIVAVVKNPQKTALFSLEERVGQISQVVGHLPNVEVDSFSGLTVHYARMKGARVLIRGLRAVSDFELELQMAHTNKTLAKEIETVFLTTKTEYSFLSSSVVKEIARLGGAIAHLVPSPIVTALEYRYGVKSDSMND